MKIEKHHWIYIIATIVTLFGIVTGQYLFILLAFPLGITTYVNKNKDDNEEQK